MKSDCTEKDIFYVFGRRGLREQIVTVSCKGCSRAKELPSLTYFKMWGYPTGTEELPPFEWLHKIEQKEGRETMERVKISFIDTVNSVTLGTSTIPFDIVTKLNVGDRIEFKEGGAIFGIYEIQSFAVNHGFPEGQVYLYPLKAKAKIKLQQINQEYMDSLLPF